VNRKESKKKELTLERTEEMLPAGEKERGEEEKKQEGEQEEDPSLLSSSSFV
jgi:hypothetical protein